LFPDVRHIKLLENIESPFDYFDAERREGNHLPVGGVVLEGTSARRENGYFFYIFGRGGECFNVSPARR
jgi:hypothetical protein